MNRKLIAGGIFLVLLVLYLILRTGATGGAGVQTHGSVGGEQSDAVRADEVESQGVRSSGDARNVGAEGASGNEGLLKLNSAFAKVNRALEEDEARRARFVEKLEKTAGEAHFFEIRRRPDFSEFVEKLCAEFAASEGVNLSALKNEVMVLIDTFDIPEGYVTKVMITVPDDPDEDVAFVSIPEVDPAFVGERTKRMMTEVGKVPFGRKSWRFSRLFPLEYRE